MNFFKKRTATPQEQGLFLCSDGSIGDLFCSPPPEANPYLLAAVNFVAQDIGRLPLHLMQNDANAYSTNSRVENSLSKKLDISPCSSMTREAFYELIARSLLLYGNAVLKPTIKDGYIEDLELLDPKKTTFSEASKSIGGYTILSDGVLYLPENVVHIRINPSISAPHKGIGYPSLLKDALKSLEQAEAAKTTLMAHPLPSLILGAKYRSEVDRTGEETARRRDDLFNRLDAMQKNGKMIIGPEYKLDQIKPSTAADLGLDAAEKNAKKQISAALGIPAYVLGLEADGFSYNDYVKGTLSKLAKTISSALTQALLTSPTLFLQFDLMSLYRFDHAQVLQLKSGGIITGNEARKMLGFPAVEVDGMDDFLNLENYISVQDAQNQSKLNNTNEEVKNG